MKFNYIGIISLLFIVLFPIGKASASEIIITPKQNQVLIYDNRGNVLSEVGQMHLKEPMVASQSTNEDYWQVKFGNAYGLILKDQVHIDNTLKIPAKSNQANSNSVVLVNKDSDVFDNSTGSLKKFAHVKAGIRYPVLSEFGNWWRMDIGGRVGFLHKSSTTIDKGVPVLMYHHILTPEEKADSPFAHASTTITTTQFNEEMDYLKKNGFITVSTTDLEGYLNKELNLPANAIVLTIDDGNISSRIYAYPKLKEHGFVADQFIITERTPMAPQPFNHKDLQFLSVSEMDAMSDVYQYMGHTHSLHNLTSGNISHLVSRPRDIVKKDLLLNRKSLNNTTYLAYPFGQYTEDTLKILRETGFTLAYTTKPGRPTLGMNKLVLPRIGIEPNLSLEDFAKKVATGEPVIVKPIDPIPNENKLFKDVQVSDEFYSSVKSLTDRGFIRGFTDGTFKPFNNVTRGQAAKILALTLNLETENVQDPGFSDVNKTDEYYGPIAALVREGIISGYPDGTFKQGNTLKRSQMAKMIHIGFELETEHYTDGRFTDVTSGDEFSGYVQSLLTNEITKGTTATTFSPFAEVKRGQLASFITRSEMAVQILPKIVEQFIEEEIISEDESAE